MLNSSVGIIEKFLNLFNIYNFPWASSPKTALLTAGLIDIWVYAPFVIILALAGINSLPKSPLKQQKSMVVQYGLLFKTLTLPMLKPFLYIALIFRLIGIITRVCYNLCFNKRWSWKCANESITNSIQYRICILKIW